MTPSRPDPAFRFSIALKGDAATGLSFSEISGLERAPAPETGTESRFVHHLPQGAAHANLLCKRGLAPADSAIAVWAKDTIEAALAAQIKARDLVVTLTDAAGEPVARWIVGNAFPVKWEIGGLAAAQHEIALETLEFAYTTLTRNQ